MTSRPRLGTYAEFWPYYLQEHSKPATRAWHAAGTLLAAILLFVALARLDARLLLGAVVAGYGPAWLSHLLIEKNTPTTFRYPVWSFISDVRMAALYWTRRPIGKRI